MDWFSSSLLRHFFYRYCSCCTTTTRIRWWIIASAVNLLKWIERWWRWWTCQEWREWWVGLYPSNLPSSCYCCCTFFRFISWTRPMPCHFKAFSITVTTRVIIEEAITSMIVVIISSPHIRTLIIIERNDGKGCGIRISRFLSHTILVLHWLHVLTK